MQGTIHRLIRGKGFGFIQVDERQYFFHHSEGREIEFRKLSIGDVVEFQGLVEGVDCEGAGGAEERTPRAVKVFVVKKAEPPPAPPPAPPKAKEGGRGRRGPAAGQGPRRPPADGRGPKRERPRFQGGPRTGQGDSFPPPPPPPGGTPDA